MFRSRRRGTANQMTSIASQLPNRMVFPVLDGLRAVAALSVFSHHVYQQFSEQWPDKYLASVMRHLGPWGVAVFFVLSGFCIHWARLMDENRGIAFQLKVYLTRRFYRIYPAFFVCVVLSFVLGRIYSSHLLPHAASKSVFAHLGLLSSFFAEHRVAVNNVLWSVVIECHFYLLYAVFWRHFDGPRKTMRILIVAWLVSILTFGISFSILPAGPNRVVLQNTFLASWWVWCLGALLAEWIHQRQSLKVGPRHGRMVWMTCLLLSLLIGLLPHPVDLQARRFLLPLLVAGFLYFLLQDEGADNFRIPFLMSLGAMSYSLYLFHPLAIWLGLYVEAETWPAIGIMLLAGMAMAAVGYRWIEMPFVALGKRALSR